MTSLGLVVLLFSIVTFINAEVKHLNVYLSDKVVIECSFPGYVVNVGAFPAFMTYDVEWTYEGNTSQNISKNHELSNSHFVLEYVDAIWDKPDINSTTYNLIIPVAKIEDSGLYACTLSEKKSKYREPTLKQPITHFVNLTVGTTPPSYETCQLPDEWLGEYHHSANFYVFNSTNMTHKIDDGWKNFKNAYYNSEFTCLKSFKNKYLMTNKKENCTQCYMINEKHSNVLEFINSPCSHGDPEKEDLLSLCAGSNYAEKTVLVRKDSVIQCPFRGTRTFIYQTDWSGGRCPIEHSAIYARNNDSYLTFFHNPCPKQTNPNVYPSPNRFECRATWSEGDLHYIMFRDNNFHGTPENFYCATYKEFENEKYLYLMSHRESIYCGELKGNFKYIYEIYDNVVVPGNPIINGYDPVEPHEVGQTLNLTCASHGGFPIANITWFRNGEKLETAETEQDETKVTSLLGVEIEDDEEGVNYTCQASNYATKSQAADIELNATLTINKHEVICHFPNEWIGEYHKMARFYKFTSTSFNDQRSNFTCLKSNQNKYLIRNEKKKCTQCYIINQKHSNLLELSNSPCSSGNSENEDLMSLCNSVDDSTKTILVRKDSVTQCPFRGTRTFIYQTNWSGGRCPREHSAIYASNNDSYLSFFHNPCPKQTSPNVFPSVERFECRATWSEGDLHYIVFRANTLYGEAENFYCATYKEVENEDYLYLMSHRESIHCGELESGYKYIYEIYDNAVVPGSPTISGYDPTAHHDVGESLNLTCVSQGGFPIANITWFKNGERLETAETEQDTYKVESHLDIQIEAEEYGVNYTCRAFNYATEGNNIKLDATISLLQ